MAPIEIADRRTSGDIIGRLRTCARSAAPWLWTSVWTLAVGCGGSEEASQASGGLRFDAADVRVLGSSPSIAVVRDLDVAADGSVWLLNSVEPLFLGFAPDGRVIGEHGAEGGGPEEYRLPLGLVTGGYRGHSWVVDFARHSMIRVSAPDSGWTEMSLPRDSLPSGSLMGGMNILVPGLRTGRLGSEIVIPRTTGSMEEGIIAFRMAALRADLMGYDPDTETTRRILSLGEVLGEQGSDFVATDGGFPLWFRLWGVCGEEVRVYDRSRDELRGFDGEGREVEAITAPDSFDEASPTQFAKAVFALRQAEVTGAVGPRLSAEDSARVLRENRGRRPGQFAGVGRLSAAVRRPEMLLPTARFGCIPWNWI